MSCHKLSNRRHKWETKTLKWAFQCTERILGSMRDEISTKFNSILAGISRTGSTEEYSNTPYDQPTWITSPKQKKWGASGRQMANQTKLWQKPTSWTHITSRRVSKYLQGSVTQLMLWWISLPEKRPRHHNGQHSGQFAWTQRTQLKLIAVKYMPKSGEDKNLYV